MSGLSGPPNPQNDSVTTETSGVTKTSVAYDRLGNSSTGSVTVKLDRTAPAISGSSSPAQNEYGWNNTDVAVSFTCSDGLSGIRSCIGSTILTTEGYNPPVTGFAGDNAGNGSGTTIGPFLIDKTAPVLSGAPTTQPNLAGWYNGDVVIDWTASDALSGILEEPANSAITGEGSGLTASATVYDRAGNAATAASTAVNIDRTAPNTTATAPDDWNNVDVTISLLAADALSGVDATYYRLNGAEPQAGTEISISEEGEHTLVFWSEDKAGNKEAEKTIVVKIDKTKPTINHTLNPVANSFGWNNSSVTVTFVCGDTLSGIATCTDPVFVVTEGKDQSVTGIATDNAGNSAEDPATVSIDKTAPDISGAPDRAANANGWYREDVVITFTADDSLSGVATYTTPVTLSEGANQYVTGTAQDTAENSASTTVGPYNVDKSAPVITGQVGAPNRYGWYNADVTVAWTCSDNLSGLDGDCPADNTITGEGDALSVSVSASDLAGNTGSGQVGGIKIDRTAPYTLVSVPDPLDSGWYAGDVQVTLTTGPDLSGVTATYYSVDGGPAQEYGGPFTHSLKGIHTITFWSEDKAGNVEDAAAPGHSIELKIDGTPPAITGSRLPLANSFGWNNGPVLVSFTCSDQESGVASCSGSTDLTLEGAGQSVTGEAADVAGNSASATVANINIDLTPPTITGAATLPANSYGWYKEDVTINWTPTDALSGIDSVTIPADSVISGEGDDLGAGPVTVYDKAGNAGSGSVSGIKIDRTPPTISGEPTTAANSEGWYKDDVIVLWTVNDHLSGILAEPADSTITGEGSDLSTTASVSDLAGNEKSASVTGIKIDRTAPITGITTVPAWSKEALTLTLAPSDNLSGVMANQYSINGGTPAYGTEVVFEEDGVYILSYWSTDRAGNVEFAKSIEVKVDRTAPTISHELSPAPNGNNWNNNDVTVIFTCQDNLSGVTFCTGPQKVTAEGEGIEVSGTAADTAGNTNSDTAVVNLDKTAPTITATRTAANLKGWNNEDVVVEFTCSDALSGVASCTPTQTVSSEGAGQSVAGEAVDSADNISITMVSNINIDKTAPTIDGGPDRAANEFGWYNANVTVSFLCTDALSGIDTCSSPTTLGEGANQSVTGSAADNAENTNSRSVNGINIDKTAPFVSLVGGPANGSSYYFGSVPAAPTCSASDALSGLDGACNISGYSPMVGTHTITTMAKDKAGNTSTATATYTVLAWTLKGFYQPVDMNGVYNTVKNGSTVPLKFEIFSGPTELTDTASVKSLTYAQTSCNATATSDEIETLATGNTVLRYDMLGGQFIYNWKTPASAGKCYRVTMTTLDNSSLVAFFKLK